jgi:hypothetical protein
MLTENEINIQILEHRNKINELIILKRKMIIDKRKLKEEQEKPKVDGFEFFKELFKAFDDNSKGLNTKPFVDIFNRNPSSSAC